MPRKKTKKNTGIKLIKKANKLVESRYKFDIWETRMFLSVLSQIHRSDEDFKVYRIWYKDVIKSFELRSAQSYELLRNAAKGLMRKVFYLSDYVDGKRRETEYHIIRSVNYLAEGEKVDDSQEYVDITIDPDMKPLLLQLGDAYVGGKKIKGENYTAYDLRNVIKLGAYHIRIYELLKQHQRIGHRTLDIEEVKRMLEITSEYPLFGNFFQKVIKPSVRAINENTDLTITNLEYEEVNGKIDWKKVNWDNLKVKEGRRVVALHFRFREKDKEEMDLLRGIGIQKKLKFKRNEPIILEEKASLEESMVDRLFSKYQETVVQKFGVTPTVFMKLLNGTSEEQVEQAIRVTRRMNAQNEIKKNIAGFFIKALREGYTDPKEEARKKQIEKANKAKVIEEQLVALEEEKSILINDKIKALVGENPEITNQAIEKMKKNEYVGGIILQKEEELGRSLVLEDYRQDVVLRNLVKRYIIELKPKDFENILNNHRQKVKKLKAQL